MSGELSVRAAAREDVPAILTLLMDDDLGELHEGGLTSAHGAAFTAIAEDENQILAVALLENEVVGCLQITFIPGLSRQGMWRGQIESVRIARSLRNSGYGTAFLRWAIARCIERNCGLVQLFMNKSRHESHRFYDSLGFRASHEGFRLYL